MKYSCDRRQVDKAATAVGTDEPRRRRVVEVERFIGNLHLATTTARRARNIGDAGVARSASSASAIYCYAACTTSNEERGCEI